MNKSSDRDRRDFLKLAGVAAAGAAFGSFSFSARAELEPAKVRFAHLTDTMFSAGDDPKSTSRAQKGLMIGETYALADDLLAQLADPARKLRPEFIIHGGGLTWSGRAKQREAASKWLGKSPLPVRLTPGGKKPEWSITARARPANGFYAHEAGGVRFIHLAAHQRAGTSRPELIESERQFAWLWELLDQDPAKPTVIVTPLPMIEFTPGSPELDHLQGLLRSRPQIILILAGGAFKNFAAFVRPESPPLYLTTASTALYPCGARLIELTIEPDRKIKVVSEFVQTRLTQLVEQSYYLTWPEESVARLGPRGARSFKADGDIMQIAPARYEALPPEPWWPGRDSFTLALLADTHICLDKFVPPDRWSDYELIGHYTEEGSRALLSDVLEQCAAGRHRVEFYDEVFKQDPLNPVHHLDLPVDGMLIAGDLVERGKIEEARLFRSYLEGLPAGLRGRSLVAIGNHDMYRSELCPTGPTCSRKPIADFYAGYGPSEGETDYVVHPTDWLTLIVLNTTIPSFSGLGLIQDKIDWLEDQLEAFKDRAVIVASHHPIYRLSLAPPLMRAYLKVRSDFRPKRSSTRTLLHELFARHNNVKLLISGHYHGVVADQFKKRKPAGPLPDDGFTTHLQVPCLIEYPAGYRLLKVKREGNRGVIEYISAYTREWELRLNSSRASIFRVFGTRARPSKEYRKALERLSREETFFGDLAKLDPYDLSDLNVRGFKDGTANRGRGNTGKPNINGRIEFTI